MARPEAWMTARPIAHRGLHDRAKGVIENSPKAALAAIAGRFAIECDVQLTADGDAVVFHDFELDRLTAGAGRVDALTTAQLEAIQLKDTSDRIPSLSRFLDLIDGRAPLVLEIKSRFDGDMRLTRRVAEIVNASPHPIVLKSFDPRIVTELRTLTPNHARGVVAMLDYGYPTTRPARPRRSTPWRTCCTMAKAGSTSCPGACATCPRPRPICAARGSACR